MLNKPILALCENRSKLSSTGKMQNILDSLFSNTRLKQLGLSSIDFDFFINWKDNSVSNEIWIKRTLDNEINIKNFNIAASIKSVDSPLYIKSLIEFANSKNLSLKYKIFYNKDLRQWDTCKMNKTQEILEIGLTKNGLTNPIYQSIDDLMNQIKLLSGGPMKIGDKGLIYSTSSLECYLSTSHSPWPGDADILIMDAHKMQPLVLIELN